MKTNARGKELIAMFKDEYDAAISRTAAERAVTMLIRRRLTGNQFSAIVSLVMSIGLDEFRASRMLRLINTMTLSSALEASDEFDTYIYEYNDSGERTIDPFLIKQREMEKALFLLPEAVRVNG